LFFQHVCAGYAASCLPKFTDIFLTSKEVVDVPKRLHPTMKLRCFRTTAKAGYLPPSQVVFQHSTVQNKEPQPSTANSQSKYLSEKYWLKDLAKIARGTGLQPTFAYRIFF
jgi:hypothetical protein